MASFNKLLDRLVLSSSLAAVIMSLFFVHSNADMNLISEVCSKADDVKNCVDLFLTDPRSEKADVLGLALIAIQTTINKVQDTIVSRIPHLLNTITDPVGKRRLGVCKSLYTDALYKFQNVFDFTDKHAYFDAINWMRFAVNHVIECQNNYRKDDPIAESPLSAENNEIAIKLAAVILTVIDRLIGN